MDHIFFWVLNESINWHIGKKKKWRTRGLSSTFRAHGFCLGVKTKTG